MLTKKQFKKSLNKKNKKVNSTKKNKTHYRKKTRLNKLKNVYNGGANGELKITPQEISHYWFKQWDDHGVPDFTDPTIKDNFDTFITTLYKDIKDNENNELNTTVIHCSDGSGRSGVVYVILSILFKYNFNNIDKITITNAFVLINNIIDTIKNGRKYRDSLVETEAQCKFIFTYLLTKITFEKNLLISDTDVIEDFKTIIAIKKSFDSNISCNTEAEFNARNKNANILPNSNYQIILKYDNRDTCNYINASRMIPLNQQRNQVIITQCPIQYTIPHFYLMLHQQKVKRIVMVNNLVETDAKNEKNEKICSPYITDKSNIMFMSDMGKNKNEFKSTLVLTPTNDNFILMDTTAQSAKAAQVLKEQAALEKKAAQVAQAAQEKADAQEKEVQAAREAKAALEKADAQVATELQAEQAAQEKEAAQAALKKEAAQAALEKEAAQETERLEKKAKLEKEAQSAREAKAAREKEKEEQEEQEAKSAQDKASQEKAAQAANAELEKEKAAQEAKSAQPQPKTSICELLRLYKPKLKKKIKESSI